MLYLYTAISYLLMSISQLAISRYYDMSWFCGFAYSDPETWNEVDPSTEDQEYFSEQANQL